VKITRKARKRKKKGKERSGTESEQAEEYELKIAKRGKRNAKNSSGSVQAESVRNAKGSGGQMPKKAKRSQGEKKITSSSLAEDNTPCKFCGKRFNMPEDDKAEDDWIMCSSCKLWAHETCGEKHDIIGDDEYICINCARLCEDQCQQRGHLCLITLFHLMSFLTCLLTSGL